MTAATSPQRILPGVLEEEAVHDLDLDQEQNLDQAYDSDADAEDDWGPSRDTLHEGQVIKAGYLMKKGERLKIWKKKWFVLRTSKLAYYKDNKEYELLRIIDIKDVHRAAEVQVKHKTGVFVVLTPHRTFTVQAKNPADMREWIKAINQAKFQSDVSSSSDLDSYSGSNPQLEQPSSPQPTQTPQLSLQPADSSPSASEARLAKSSLAKQGSGMLLPRRQQRNPRSLADPELLTSPGNNSRSNMNHALGTSVSDQLNQSSPPNNMSILDQRSTGLNAFSSSRGDAMDQMVQSTEAIQIASSSPHSPSAIPGPRPRDIQLPPNSFSSSYSHNNTSPGTPSSPGYYSGGESFWTGDFHPSSGDEEIQDDPTVLEAGRVACEAGAPGSGLVTGEQLESKVVRQGYLLKLGNKYKTWRKKWFVLRGDKLTYYKNTKEYQPHGIIPLSTIIDCLQIDPASKSKQYCLRIVTAKRSFVCCAPDEDTLLQWLDALHVECDRVAQEEEKEDQRQRQADHEENGGGGGAGADGAVAMEGAGPGSGRRMSMTRSPSGTLPRMRSKSDQHSLGSSSQQAGTQLRKILSLESTTAAGGLTSSSPLAPPLMSLSNPQYPNPSHSNSLGDLSQAPALGSLLPPAPAPTVTFSA